MSSSVDLTMFDADRLWLERQVGMRPWGAAQSRLTAQLDAWLAEYRQRLLGSAGPLTGDLHTPFLKRLWGCWSYHWHTAADEKLGEQVDGWQVADSIRSGRSPTGNGRLGGDPLGDVVMAEAVLQQNEIARRKFYDGYRDFALGLAARVSVRLANDEAWWSDLVSKLAGDLEPPGKLARYIGKCGLQNWLGTVVRREALDAVRAPPQFDVPVPDPPRPAEDLISRECRALFVKLISETLALVPAEDRLLLVMLLVEQRSGKEVAACLGIHPGNVTRRKSAAIETVQKQLASTGSRTKSYEPCLEQLLCGPDRIDFGGLLAGALSSSVEEAAAV